MHTIEIIIPTAEQEFDYIYGAIIKQIPLLLQGNYDISLPNHKDFKELIKKDLNFESVNFEHLKDIFIKEFYDEKNYQEGYKTFNASKKEILKYFLLLGKWEHYFGFKFFEQYNLILTLYGPGGSYDALNGIVITKINKEGIPARTNPLFSPLHEIVHIGIEGTIVMKYRLSHSDKERLVDVLCSEYLKIPNYQMQDYRNPELDKYIQNIDLKDLPKQVEKYKSKYQP
jgi:hypothetical protein